MPDPFDFYSPYGSYASLFGSRASRQPSARDLLPQVDPEEEKGIVGWALEGALGGLGYIGGLLDKTFGGRGIRGALGGRPEELLSIIPLSDSLGITDPRNEVTGRDLLADVGVTTRRQPDEPFNWSDDILGMGAEIILDPSTFLSLGTTAAGKVAQKSATGLAKGLGAQLRAGQRGLTVGFPFTGTSAELLSGPQVLGAASWMRSGATAPTRGLDYVSNAISGYKPFQGAQRTIYDNVLEPVGRNMTKWFDDAVAEASSRFGQISGRDFTAGRFGFDRQANIDAAARELALKKITAGQTPEVAEQLMRAVASTAENSFDPLTLYGERRRSAFEQVADAMRGYYRTGVKDDEAALRNIDEFVKNLGVQTRPPEELRRAVKSTIKNQQSRLKRSVEQYPNPSTTDPAYADLMRLRDEADRLRGLYGDWASGALPRAEFQTHFPDLFQKFDRTDVLTLKNREAYEMLVKPAQKYLIDQMLPGGVPYPKASSEVQLLGAAEDLINQGYLPRRVQDVPPIDAIGDLTTRAQAFEAAAVAGDGHFVALDSDNLAGLIKLVGPEKAGDFQRKALGITKEELAKVGDVSFHKGGTDPQSDEFSAIVRGGDSASIRNAMARADERIKDLVANSGWDDLERVSQKAGPKAPGFSMHVEPIRKGDRLPSIDQEAGFGLETQKLRRASTEGRYFQDAKGNYKVLAQEALADAMLKNPTYRFDPSEELLRTDREKLARKIAKDTEFGPGSLNDPWLEDNKAFRAELRDWMKNGVRGMDDPLFQGVFGDLATQAAEKLKDTPEYQRVFSIDKALEYTPPTGDRSLIKFADDFFKDNPEGRAVFDGLVEGAKKDFAKFLEMQKAAGASAASLEDSFSNYFARQMNRFPAGDPRAAKNRTADSWQRDMKATHQFMKERKSMVRHIPGSTSTIDSMAMDPRISGAARTASDTEAQQIIQEILTGMKNPAEGNPAIKQAKELNEWLKGLPAEHVEKQMPFFSADFPTTMLNYQKGVGKIVALSNTLADGVLRFSNTAEGWAKEGRGADTLVSVRDLVKQIGLRGSDEGGSVFAQKVLGSAEEGKRSLRELKDMLVPKEYAEDVLKFQQMEKDPATLQGFLGFYDKAIDLTKAGLTRPFPSFHARNFVSNLFNAWRSGAIDLTKPIEAFKTLRAAWHFTRGHGGDNLIQGLSRDELIKELAGARIAIGRNTSMTADTLGASGQIIKQGMNIPEATGRSLVGDIGARLKEEGQAIKANANPLSLESPLSPLNTRNSLIQLMTEAGEQIDDATRIFNYAALRNKGWAPEAAAEQVMKYQIDYTRSTNFERNIARRVLPWYMFTSRNLPVVLEDLVTQPRKITAPMRLSTGGRPQGEFVPSYIGEGAALPLGQNPDGTQRYLTSFGLPIEDESLKTLGSLLKGDFTRAGEQVLGMTFPWIKSPLEMIFGKQLYSGRPLTDLKPYEFADLGGLLNEKQARVLTELAANTPASRTLSTVNRFTDPRKDFVDQLLGFGTGAKISDVDVNRAYNAAITKVIGDMLKGQSGVRTREEVYVPADRIPMLNQADAEKYALYLRAEQRLREAAEARKKAAAK